MGRSTQVVLELTKFPLTLAVGLRTTFDDVLPTPLPDRLAALMRRWNTEEGEPEHGASYITAPYRIDRRGRSRPSPPHGDAARLGAIGHHRV